MNNQSLEMTINDLQMHLKMQEQKIVELQIQLADMQLTSCNFFITKGKVLIKPVVVNELLLSSLT